MSNPPEPAPPGAGDAEHELVAHSLGVLGRRVPFRVVRRLAAGRSGSQVFLLELDGEQLVLKVTEHQEGHRGASRELAVYRELGRTLHDFLPALRAGHHDGQAVRLLLTAHEVHPPAVALPQAHWVRLAERLGELHARPVARPTWLRSAPQPSPQEVTLALRRWDGYGEPELARRAAELLSADPAARLRPGPVLTHGDCHLGNLLLGPAGQILWVDWQEACLSSGLGDLVFLWQRAEFEGARPPREAMTSAYAAARSLHVEDGLRAALDAVELRLLLVSWPPFLGYGSEDGRRTMIRRLRQLARDPTSTDCAQGQRGVGAPPR